RLDDASECNVASLVGTEDSGGNLVEGEPLLVDPDGMAGVRAPVKPDDDVVIFGQSIDDLTFAFVAKLETDDCSVRVGYVAHDAEPPSAGRGSPHGQFRRALPFSDRPLGTGDPHP